MKYLFIVFLWLPFIVTAQNVGVGTTNPQQKLHVAGNVRVDGISGSTGVLKYNSSGDLVPLPNSGNANEALLGNGNWGTVPGTLPAGAIVGSASGNDQNLLSKGFSLFGYTSGHTQYSFSVVNAAPNTWASSYVEGDIQKLEPPDFGNNDIFFWVDTVMYVLANNSFYAYNPIADTWRFVLTNPTSFKATFGCESVWTGTEIIVWGGNFSVATDNGFRYNPSTNVWTAIPTTGQPSARSEFGMQFISNRLVVWGGLSSGGTLLNDGAVLNFATNTWSTINTTGAPSARMSYSCVNNTIQNSMIVWAGKSSTSVENVVGDGAMYNPVTNLWTPITATNAPIGRSRNVAVWSGTEMIIHGGYGGNTSLTYLNTGGRYNPVTNSWTTTSITGSPRLELHAGVWIGNKMLISGGSANIFNTVGTPFESNSYLYDPVVNSWQVSGIMGVKKGGHKLILGANVVLAFGGGTSIINPSVGTYSFFGGLPNGSRFFLISTSTTKLELLNPQKMYLYVKQ